MARAQEKPGWAKARITNTGPQGLPVPSKEQAVWQDCEVGMFFHFDIPIYKPGWNFRTFKDFPSPELYNPAQLDCDQWMAAAQAIGAKYAVLVAKHCSGFLCWQSDLYPYGVKQSPWRGGKGDVVKDFVEACRKHKIKPGLYASVTANGYLEVDNPGRVNRGKGGDDKKQAAYARQMEKMCEELWSRYGELFEIWFDGGALAPDKGGPDLVPLLRKHQPKAMVFQGPAATIRWIGNESGVANYPNWSTIKQIGGQEDVLSGDPGGKIWMPGECDVPIRNHEWFWNPGEDHKVYPLEALMDMYYRSVGYNANLLLNANPNPDGLVPEADVRRYQEFGKEIQRRFGKPVAETAGKGTEVVLQLKRPSVVDHVVIMEDIVRGERVRAYEVEGRTGAGEWKKLCGGISVGHKRIQAFDPVEVAEIRLKCAGSTAEPLIRKLAVYKC